MSRKTFFAVELEANHIDSLILFEGQGMDWFDFDQILANGGTIVPYDLAIIVLYEQINEQA